MLPAGELICIACICAAIAAAAAICCCAANAAAPIGSIGLYPAWKPGVSVGGYAGYGGGGGATATADQKTRHEDDRDRALPPWSLMRALRAANVTAVALIATCSEGDNTEDAAAMADAVAGVLGLGDNEMRPAPTDEKVTNDGSERGLSRWTIPPSWRAAYGQQPMASELFA